MLRTTLGFTALMLLAAAPLQAAIKTQPVDYKVGDLACKGYLAYDDSLTGQRPGVLIGPEWWGLTPYAKHRAEQLAALGYVAMALDPYGAGKTTADPAEAGKLAGALKKDVETLRARATAALNVLKKDEHVDPKRIAAIGYCFGGTTALELARSGADITAVVTFHAGLASAHQEEDAKAIKARILVCHGGDDTFESPEEIAGFQKALRDAKVDWQMNVYGGAVHSFTNPDADKHGIKGIAYNAEADHRSWQAMKNFFREVFKEQSKD